MAGRGTSSVNLVLDRQKDEQSGMRDEYCGSMVQLWDE